VLADQLTPEEEAYFNKFDTAWKSYFDQSPDVWLKFLILGDNSKNSIKSIDSLTHAELQLSKRLMIHAHMLKNSGLTWRRLWDTTFMLIIKSLAAEKRNSIA